MPPKYLVGLTGNIASGKSTVAQGLERLGADVVDADEVAHEALRPGTPETAAIRQRFGDAVLAADGSVDRAALGRVVFPDARALSDLEGIVHPGTRRRILERVAKSTAHVAVIEAIKLLEGPLAEHVNAVWVVTAPAEVRVRRLVDARGLSLSEATQRVDAQNPEEDKVRRADVVLTNDRTVDELRAQVARAWADLMRSLAAGERARAIP